MRVHYPRTPHLPWSPGAGPDDVRAGGVAAFAGREVVVTEKLDGENTTLYRDGLHARSLDSAHHPSRAWVKAAHGRVAAGIPAGWRVCGENLFARHSLPYTDLDGYFYAFSVWAGDECLSWDDTVRITRRLGLPVPPVLWRGVFDERALRALRLDLTRQEGYVVRTAAGFGRAGFADHVAKWVRAGHVRTGTHWMHGPVIPNGLGRGAPLWAVRGGAPVDAAALADAVGVPVEHPADRLTAEAQARLDVLGRTGDARLAGVLATLLHSRRRTWIGPHVAAETGDARLARRVADLVGLHPLLHREIPDGDRRAGLLRLSVAADVGVLHAVAGAVLAGRRDPAAVAADEQLEWSALHADDAGLLGPVPPERELFVELRASLAGAGADAADRCWAEARAAFAAGRITTAAEAPAYSWRWRSGAFGRLVALVGPAGSGKSTVAAGLSDVDEVVSMDELRAARGDRADQRANPAVLRAALARLDAGLRRGATVVWDATSLTPAQRATVLAVGRRHDALTTQVVPLVPEAETWRRNAVRAHPVPDRVLAAQLRAFVPPYPGEAHRVWYVDPAGRRVDTAGDLADADRELGPARPDAVA